MTGASSFGTADRERLAELLAQLPRGEAMQLDELQGLAVAVSMAGGYDDASGDWFSAAAAGDDSREREILTLLEAYRLATARALEEGSLVIEGRTTRTGRIDYEPWCRAFLNGVEAGDWFALADADELEELLFPIDVVADALPERQRATYAPAQWRDLVHECTQGLPQSVERLRDYWRILRSPPPPMRRDQPKVGRNDPCPCGSGKKHKHCHGR